MASINNNSDDQLEYIVKGLSIHSKQSGRIWTTASLLQAGQDSLLQLY